MTQNNVRYLLAGIAVLGNGTFALAQSSARNQVTTARPAPRVISATVSAPINAAPAAFVDVHPFQSQVSVRILTAGINEGTFQVIPAATVDQYRYHVAGVQADQFAYKTALVYDKRNPLPKATLTGLNYTFYDGGFMTTLAADGTFIYKGKTTFQPATVGGVYFTEQGTNNLVVVDSYGLYFNTFKPAPIIRIAGGNYFIDQSGILTTIRSTGTVGPGDATNMISIKEGNNFSNTTGTGGNFFVASDGNIITISSIDGFFKTFKPNSLPKLIGGNYYIGLDNRLYTVGADGNLTMTDDFSLSVVPNLMAYNFMKFPNGRILMVDEKGMPHDSLLHISSTGANVEVVKTISSNLDSKTIYLPKSSK